MGAASRIYLDNAATSFPKPESVYEAVDRYNRQLGAAVGRSAYRSAVDVQKTVDRCRQQAAALLGAESSARILFTFNGTDGLNLALHGLINPGDHVVTSVVEHNSVLRPLRDLQERQNVEVTYVDCDEEGRIDPAAIQAALCSRTRLVTVLQASNVTGTIQPVEDIGEVAHAAGALFLVDAAQSAGHLPLNVGDAPIDLLACPGHKGLLGPLGTGLLYVAPGVEEQLRSVRQGGTGSRSEEDRQPAQLPDKYESGNHNAPGLFGLNAALSFLQEKGIGELRRHEQELTARLLEGLQEIPGLQIPGGLSPENRVGVVSVSHPGWEPQVFSSLLDEHFGIETRAGLHCAPRIHQRLGTLQKGGTVRFSVGPFNTAAHIEQAVSAVRELIAAVP